ncbi:recombinase family protein [Microbacterium sp. P01]|uniref:recombinase family protein n=1 Tax=Microbacterium sp. P01 TaxID=3366261 RepID=UPI00366F90A4
MTRAGVYMRQSLDRDNRQEGIDRQRERTRGLADARGWDVVEEYIDNDVSASKPRGVGTAWHRLVNDAKTGRIDVVVAVDQDRLLRGLRDLVTLLDLGVRIATVDGELDLTTADGEFRATLSAGLARFEVRRKSERQLRANEHGRKLGVPPGGRRAFGYTTLAAGAKSTRATRLGADGLEYPAYGHEPYEPEASAVRRGFELLLAGSSIRAIARAWNDSGLTTTQGGPWTPSAVRGLLSNPRYAAQVAPPRASGTASTGHYLGLDDVTPGSWEPLVPLETWLAACAILRDPARRSSPGATRRWLLSGIASCGICGAPMKIGATPKGARVYKCTAANHLARKADDADLYIVGRVIERLTDPDEAGRLKAAMQESAAPDVQGMRAELLAAQQGESNVLSMVASGLTSMAKAEAALRDVRHRIATLEGRMAEAGTSDVLGPWLEADEVAELWDASSLDEQRAVVKALWSSIELASPGKGSRPPRDAAGRMAHTARTILATPA